MAERIFFVRPAYDCIGVQPCVKGSAACIPGSGGSHGRNNAVMYFTARGPDAEVTLVIGTGWDLPTVPVHQRISNHGEFPRGRFVEIHTARPVYEDQERREPQPGDTCYGWAGCYVNTGYTMSDEPTALLVNGGSDAVWEWLEDLLQRTLTDMEPE